MNIEPILARFSSFSARAAGSLGSTASLSFVSTGGGFQHQIGTMYSNIPRLIFSDAFASQPYLMVHGWAVGHNNTAGDGIAVILVASTVGIPSHGASIPSSDKTFTLTRVLVSTVANEDKIFPFAEWFEAADASAMTPVPVPGDTIYIYLAYQAVTGGAATIGSFNLMAES